MNEAETRAELIDPLLTADYVLSYRNTQLAVVEAKADGLPLTEGVGQAKARASTPLTWIRARKGRPKPSPHRKILSALPVGKREQQNLPAFLRACCTDVGQSIWPIPCSCAACWPRLAITYESVRETYRLHWHPAKP